MTHLYEHSGKMFYSIAAIDKTIRKEEIEKLKQIINKESLPLENSFNEFGDDTAYEIEIVFDWMVANEWNWNKCCPTLKFSKQNTNTCSLHRLIH